jgi:methionine-S-sulfoxide reductase
VEKAIFAAGCFWGVQYYFDQVPGVISTIVGYTGGNIENPSYELVCTHTTGHAEALEITFDPNLISYSKLVKHFFKMHDPTTLDRQGPDIGDSYRSAIFYLDDTQKDIAEKERDTAKSNFSEPIVTEITKASAFYPAEDYHQKFAERTGRGMCHIPYSPV